jgi:hypothetical protein
MLHTFSAMIVRTIIRVILRICEVNISNLAAGEKLKWENNFFVSKTAERKCRHKYNMAGISLRHMTPSLAIHDHPSIDCSKGFQTCPVIQRSYWEATERNTNNKRQCCPRPPQWSSGQTFLLQIQRSGFDSSIDPSILIVFSDLCLYFPDDSLLKVFLMQFFINLSHPHACCTSCSSHPPWFVALNNIIFSRLGNFFLIYLILSNRTTPWGLLSL